MVYVTHPFGGFPSSIAREPRGPQYRAIRFRKALDEMFQRRPFGTGTVLTVEIPSIENRRRGVMYNVEYGNPCI